VTKQSPIVLKGGIASLKNRLRQKTPRNDSTWHFRIDSNYALLFIPYNFNFNIFIFQNIFEAKSFFICVNPFHPLNPRSISVVAWLH